MGACSASGFNAPTSLGMQAAGLEGAVDPLLWLLVASWGRLTGGTPRDRREDADRYDEQHRGMAFAFHLHAHRLLRVGPDN